MSDDPEINASSKDVNQAESDVNDDLKIIETWFTKNGLISNKGKTEAMLIGVTSVVSKALRKRHLRWRN